MSRHIILAQSACTAAALRAWTDLLGEKLADDGILIAQGEKLDVFERGAAFIARALAEENRVTVLVDSINLSALNPCSSERWDAAVAMLILAVPEVRWVFGVANGDAAKLDDFRKAHGLARLFLPYWSDLFDGVGLRDLVRASALKGPDSCTAYLPKRVQHALALDEEKSYTCLHAYATYRFGYRSMAADSFAVARLFLSDATRPECSGIEMWNLILEDIYLNFADGERGTSELDRNPQSKQFKGRAMEWPRLEEAEHRIFITSGHHDDPAKWARNEAYIAQQQASPTPQGKPRHIRLLHKPYAGIFRIWEGSGLMHKLQWTDLPTGQTYRGFADKFIWPPSKESCMGNENGHSSPGALLVIAEALIARAEKSLSDVTSVEEALRGAVLANDALELLGCRTPTVAMEALRLKHHFEVLAECHFSGVEHHIQLEGRLAEIHRDVQAIGQWFGHDQRVTAELNAEMQILLDLVRVFREFGQFDEENICMRQVRDLDRRLWYRDGGLVEALSYPVRWYVEFLLGSTLRFVIAMVVWIFVLTGLFAATGIAWPACLEATFSSFIGIQPPTQDHHNLPITILAMVSGAGHLGILISHLYTMVSRK